MEGGSKTEDSKVNESVIRRLESESAYVQRKLFTFDWRFTSLVNGIGLSLGIKYAFRFNFISQILSTFPNLYHTLSKKLADIRSPSLLAGSGQR